MIEAFGLQLNIKSIHMFLSPSAHKKDKEGPRSLVFPHEDPRKRDRTPTRWLSLTAAKFTKCLSVFAGMRRVNYYVKHLIQASYTSESRTKLAGMVPMSTFCSPCLTLERNKLLAADLYYIILLQMQHCRTTQKGGHEKWTLSVFLIV